MRVKQITPVFVEFIPELIENGKLYISDEYEIAIHKCCCGCGEEVVTPLSPVDWQYTMTSNGISLFPSVGNWKYKCQSHYFIRENGVLWAKGMSAAQIKKVEQQDIADKQRFIQQRNEQRESFDFVRFVVTLWNRVKRLFGIRS
ncbi:DUF6527 family protein [Vibrio parahaemolyticus]|uniref:DUF6527 family protein n=2 Tax=Vibrio parahaemolyticus TaxID=670 RepID=UPI000C9C2031|nr:DUF6527 family protein [Vibrio parahaemolyticus]EGR2703827.1 hypothetical protein [Vibrio parahaemolyticus]MCZ0748458.1 DUF6527 family protein [Vibrio parahaemolyticus]MDF4512500.1 DUF6527 family protein [Vibrio parahaemolyticus]MDK9425216.1 DUF6527 family protein [Vibrio parahaemolyticus]MDK9432329.1 DUF6527 family protein [Vibrio parahaemolyticus]